MDGKRVTAREEELLASGQLENLGRRSRDSVPAGCSAGLSCLRAGLLRADSHPFSFG